MFSICSLQRESKEEGVGREGAKREKTNQRQTGKRGGREVGREDDETKGSGRKAVKWLRRSRAPFDTQGAARPCSLG